MPQVILRNEAAAYRRAIGALHRSAFGGDDEARLVEDLRAGGSVLVSLVAIDEEDLVGHILFSMLAVEVDGRPVKAAALAPLAVAASHRGRGIGARLVREGLRCVSEKAIEAVIVLGSPGYYGPFGFSAASTRHLAAPFAGEAFMAIELVPGALTGEKGIVGYPPAFGVAGP